MDLLVLVTGPPAGGKTTLAAPLAEALRLPLISKDVIKEALFDTFGVGDDDWSHRLGEAAYEVMWALGDDLGAAVYEGPMYQEAKDRVLGLCARPIEVFCHCDPDEARRRVEERAAQRHPGHTDTDKPHEVAEKVEEWAPLGLGPVLEIDTSGEVDVDEVVRWVREQAAPGRL